jgi:hypothetical protein
MELKTATWGGMMIGSFVGGFIPLLWGDSAFSMSAIFFSAIGGIVGIAAGYKFVRG